MTDRTVTRGVAEDAPASLAARQRLLRTAYAGIRYGWLETVATAWRDRPQTFADELDACRATHLLGALEPDR